MDRLNCIKCIDEPICTPRQNAITDIVRYFHGDKPAQQFEAGHSQGGNFPCSMCKAKADRFDDISYCHRSDFTSLEDRQQFVLTGSLWKENPLKPYDKLSIASLRKELRLRGRDTADRRRQALHSEFEEIKSGIATFPTLLLPEPQKALTELNLDRYEIAAIEPLHDIKGHMANLLDELLCLLNKDTDSYKQVGLVKTTVLNKDTLRCADYRKAAILISQSLKNTSCNKAIQVLMDTAAEIFKIFYSQQQRRTPRTVLRLHNLAYLHAQTCLDLLSSPKAITKRRMFGMYYHSITCHSPTVYRLVALRSLNTEFQERTFGQAKNITQQTSNMHPQHIIDNSIIRIQAEASRTLTTITEQDTEIAKLAKSMPTTSNTKFSKEYINKHSLQFQSHLERIGDYLLTGPGIWWRETDTYIEFLDGDDEPESRSEGPLLKHFSDTSLPSLQLFLFQCWERCITEDIKLPLETIRKYSASGDLTELS